MGWVNRQRLILIFEVQRGLEFPLIRRLGNRVNHFEPARFIHAHVPPPALLWVYRAITKQIVRLCQHACHRWHIGRDPA